MLQMRATSITGKSEHQEDKTAQHYQNSTEAARKVNMRKHTHACRITRRQRKTVPTSRSESALLLNPAACWAFSPACSGWNTLCHPGPASDTHGCGCTGRERQTRWRTKYEGGVWRQELTCTTWLWSSRRLTWGTRGALPGCSEAC